MTLLSMDEIFPSTDDFADEDFMDKIFLSMDGVLSCHIFVLKFYLSYFQMRDLLQMALGKYKNMFFQFSP